MSPVFDCTTPQGLADALPKVVAGIRDGQLVVLPTDTLYGVGSDAFSGAAVASLLAAKGRGREMPPPVLIGDLNTVDGLAIDVPAYARALMDAFWPGPLTLVLRAQPSLAWDLGDTLGTVALRMPDDEVALRVLKEVGPMAVSSANRTGYPGARTVLDAAAQLGAAVTYYLDGGPTRGGLASTIVDCTGPAPEVLREGAVASADVLAVVEVAAPDSFPTVTEPEWSLTTTEPESSASAATEVGEVEPLQLATDSPDAPTPKTPHSSEQETSQDE